jgi:hypothetical protein
LWLSGSRYPTIEIRLQPNSAPQTFLASSSGRSLCLCLNLRNARRRRVTSPKKSTWNGQQLVHRGSTSARKTIRLSAIGKHLTCNGCRSPHQHLRQISQLIPSAFEGTIDDAVGLLAYSTYRCSCSRGNTDITSKERKGKDGIKGLEKGRLWRIDYPRKRGVGTLLEASSNGREIIR